MAKTSSTRAKNSWTEGIQSRALDRELHSTSPGKREFLGRRSTAQPKDYGVHDEWPSGTRLGRLVPFHAHLVAALHRRKVSLKVLVCCVVSYLSPSSPGAWLLLSYSLTRVGSFVVWDFLHVGGFCIEIELARDCEEDIRYHVDRTCAMATVRPRSKPTPSSPSYRNQ